MADSNTIKIDDELKAMLIEQRDSASKLVHLADDMIDKGEMGPLESATLMMEYMIHSAAVKRLAAKMSEYIQDQVQPRRWPN